MLALPTFEGVRTCREIADGLLEVQRVEYLEAGGLFFVPPAGSTHTQIVNSLDTSFRLAPVPEGHIDPWESAEDFQWEFGDGTDRFAIPDLAVAFPGSITHEEFHENIALLAEVTSPGFPKTVENDRTRKPKHYAKADVPFYLLVDQEESTWILHELPRNWPSYQVHSTGRYSESIDLPTPFDFSIPTDQWPAYSEAGE